MTSDCAEWDCVGCGRHIIAVVLREPPADSLCAGCRLLGAEANKLAQDWQDGLIARDEFERRWRGLAAREAAATRRPGDPCGRCGHALERRAQVFHWRGQWGDGAACPACRAVWQITGEEVLPLHVRPDPK